MISQEEYLTGVLVDMICDTCDIKACQDCTINIDMRDKARDILKKLEEITFNR